MQGLLQEIQGHKAMVDRLNKTGSILHGLCGEKDAEQIAELMEKDNSRFDALKKGVREKANNLDTALQETSEVHFLNYICDDNVYVLEEKLIILKHLSNACCL